MGNFGQFVDIPQIAHDAALLHILRYLRGTVTCLFSSQQPPHCSCVYSDLDYVGDPTTEKITNG